MSTYKKSGRESLGMSPQNDAAFVNNRSTRIRQYAVGTLVLGAAAGGYVWFSSAAQNSLRTIMNNRNFGDESNGWCLNDFDDDPDAGLPCLGNFMPKHSSVDDGGWGGNNEMVTPTALALLLLTAAIAYSINLRRKQSA